MGFCNTTCLKFSKKRQQWENSGQSLTVDDINGIAHSYSMIIGKRINGIWYVTEQKRSVTTSRHCSKLRNFLGTSKSLRCFYLPDARNEISKEIQTLIDSMSTRRKLEEKQAKIDALVKELAEIEIILA
jgi:hypothetical protein